MKLVMFPPVDEDRLARIAERVDGEVVNARDEDAAAAAIADADAFFGKISPRLLAAARRLRWVQSPTASLEHYLFPELVAHDALITNMRGIFSDFIADQVMGYILCFARNLHLYVRRQIEGRWDPVGGEETRVTFATGPATVTPMDLATVHLASATLGIVGFGSIGREVARRARAFEMRVLAVDPVPDSPDRPDVAADEIAGPEELDGVLSRSDFVCIAAPHTPETVKLFRRERLRRMKPTAYLINVGRGVIVDLGHLVESLRAGVIAGAALDVFEEEPLPPGHPLWAMENVIITPHVAGVSPCVPERHLDVLLENIDRFQRGEPLRNVADRETWF